LIALHKRLPFSKPARHSCQTSASRLYRQLRDEARPGFADLLRLGIEPGQHAAGQGDVDALDVARLLTPTEN
jgi:hypothetical protein